ncbi:unnamed protein product, partial [Sphacelaria rigidula]
LTRLQRSSVLQQSEKSYSPLKGALRSPSSTRHTDETPFQMENTDRVSTGGESHAHDNGAQQAAAPLYGLATTGDEDADSTQPPSLKIAAQPWPAVAASPAAAAASRVGSIAGLVVETDKAQAIATRESAT